MQRPNLCPKTSLNTKRNAAFLSSPMNQITMNIMACRRICSLSRNGDSKVPLPSWHNECWSANNLPKSLESYAITKTGDLKDTPQSWKNFRLSYFLIFVLEFLKSYDKVPADGTASLNDFRYKYVCVFWTRGKK